MYQQVGKTKMILSLMKGKLLKLRKIQMRKKMIPIEEKSPRREDNYCGTNIQ